MTTATRTENLLAVPSCHFSPPFAQQVRRAVEAFAPTAIALEVPAGALADLEWAVGCWPSPVCAVVEGAVFPFVPGDSILEAARLGLRAGVGLHAVDAFVRRRPGAPRQLPDPALASRLAVPFQAAVEAVSARPPHLRADVAREAHMARALRALLDAGERVLWVGGASHWLPLRSRLQRGDFTSPRVKRHQWHAAERLALAPDALHRLSGMYPRLVRAYAAQPDAYDQHAVVRALVLEALEVTEANEGLFLIEAGRADDAVWAEEPASPADVTRTLAYARNLAATARVGDVPSLGELVRAAAATVGRRYAGRLLALALREDEPSAADGLPRLRIADKDTAGTFRVGEAVRRLVPGWSASDRRGGLAALADRRRALAAPYTLLPAAEADPSWYWYGHPDEERSYEAFVADLLRRSAGGRERLPGTPFLSGLGDGIDVRETLRRRHEGRVYIRSERPEPGGVTNAVIDWEHRSEGDVRLQRHNDSGWIDPSLRHVGSVSREGDGSMVSEEPHVRLVCRHFSMVSLDVPTWTPGADHSTFYGRVIQRLLMIPHDRDNIYGWLDVFFEFCAGKPLAYYSRYTPSARIHAVARRHRVRLLHVPLCRIPAHVRERQRRFRFAWLTREQWAELERQLRADGTRRAGGAGGRKKDRHTTDVGPYRKPMSRRR